MTAENDFKEGNVDESLKEELGREAFNAIMGYDSRETPRPPYFDEMLSRTQALIAEGRFITALDQIFPLLDQDPNDEWALELAAWTVYYGRLRDSIFYAPEKLPNEYFHDTRLDKIFCECKKCIVNCWVPNPILRRPHGDSLNFNPAGGRCPICKNIFCRECLIVIDGSPRHCPDCLVDVEVADEPNGRTPRQAPRRKEKIDLVLIFREGPIPPDSEYVRKLLRRYSPDVFDSNPKIGAIPKFPWPNNEPDLDFAREILSISSKIRGKLPNLDFVGEFWASDAEGNRFYLIKFYEEPED